MEAYPSHHEPNTAAKGASQRAPSWVEWIPGGQKGSLLRQALFERSATLPKKTSRALFEELFYFLSGTEKAFLKIRSKDHLLRIISSLSWLREKQTVRSCLSSKRRLCFRLFRSSLQFDFGSREVVSLVVSLNTLHPFERFTSSHLLRACCDLIPNLVLLPNSHFSFRHPEDGTISYYIEVERQASPLSSADILLLKKELQTRLEAAIERIDHRLEVPHNEEDTIRNSILLSQQIRDATDSPQMIVQYQGQTKDELEFLITYLQVVEASLQNTPPKVHVRSSLVKFEHISSCISGTLGKRCKQVSLFKVRCAKEPFFRIDHSIDFLKAREFVSHCIDEAFGKVRDLNGGVICLQYDLLNQTKKLLLSGECKDNFLFDTFFSSIYPSSMKSLLEPSHITTAFHLLLSLLQKKETKTILEGARQEVFFGFELSCGISTESVIRDARAVGVNEHELALAHLDIEGSSWCVMILLAHNDSVRSSCITQLEQTIEKAHHKIQSQHNLKLAFCRPTLVLDPRIGADFISGTAIKMLYEGLTRLDPSGNPSLAAAEHVEISPDGRRYTFTLRPSVWSNGIPVTAHDFEYGWKKVLDPSFTTYSDYLFYPIKNAKAVKRGLLPQEALGIHCIDDRTLIVDLESPAPYFLELCALWIYSPLCRETDIQRPGWAFYAGKDYVSNGPFTLNSCDPKRHIHMIRNERYWDKANVRLDEIHISIIENIKTALQLFTKGELDWIGEPLTEAPAKLFKDSGMPIYSRAITSISWLAFNLNHAPFQSKKVRQALCLALDRQSLITKCLYGDERPSHSILPLQISQLDPTIPLPYNPALACQRFEEGLTELGLQKHELPQLQLLTSERAPYTMLAVEVARMWKEVLGINLQVYPVKRKDFLPTRAKERHDIALMDWGCWYSDPHYSLSVLSDVHLSVNPTKWPDSKLVELLDTANRSKDPEERLEHLRCAEAFVMDEMPIIPVCDSAYRYMKNESLDGIAFSSFGGIDFKWASLQDNTRKQKSNELHFVLRLEPLSFDPRIGGKAISQLILYQLFEGLTRFDPSGKPQLAIARAIDISDDGTIYTFHLRSTTWSNGDELTAMDFEYAWKSVISPTFDSEYADAFFVIRNAQKAHRNECSIDDIGIRCLDAHTLQVTLEHPAPYFLDWTSNPLYSPIYRPIAKTTPQWARDVFPTFVSNGPYTIVEHRHDSHTVLKKNPSYWNTKDAAKTETLRFSIVEDPVTAYNMFRAGETDWFGTPFSIFTPPELIKKLKDEGTLRVQPTSSTQRLDCCVSKPHLSSSKIRRALACAINRQDIVSCFGVDEPATSLVSKSLSLLPSPQFADGNVEVANQLFAQGCAELGYTKETYPSLSIMTSPPSKDLAEILAKRFRTVLGIDVRVEVCELQIFLKRVASLDADLAIQEWTTSIQDSSYDLGLFKYKTSLTPTDWESPEYQRLLTEADATQHQEERTELLKNAEIVLLQEMPAIPLIYRAHTYAKNPHITGEHFLPNGLHELKRFEKAW
jgi:oligopeptide transport system substrate-binding protein